MAIERRVAIIERRWMRLRDAQTIEFLCIGWIVIYTNRPGKPDVKPLKMDLEHQRLAIKRDNPHSQLYLWAVHPKLRRVLLKPSETTATHAHWFNEHGIPSHEYDSISRGFVEIDYERRLVSVTKYITRNHRAELVPHQITEYLGKKYPSFVQVQDYLDISGEQDGPGQTADPSRRPS